MDTDFLVLTGTEKGVKSGGSKKLKIKREKTVAVPGFVRNLSTNLEIIKVPVISTKTSECNICRL